MFGRLSGSLVSVDLDDSQRLYEGSLFPLVDSNQGLRVLNNVFQRTPSIQNLMTPVDQRSNFFKVSALSVQGHKHPFLPSTLAGSNPVPRACALLGPLRSGTKMLSSTKCLIPWNKGGFHHILDLRT